MLTCCKETCWSCAENWKGHIPSLVRKLAIQSAKSQPVERAMLCKQGLSEALHDHKTVLKGGSFSTRSKDAYGTALKRNSICSVLQKGHIYDQVAFHSELITVLNLPSASVASLQWEISKSNRLLISPHLFSISVENWLSRGVWHRQVLEEGGGAGVIHCWSKACLNFHLQFWQERTLKNVSVFHLIFMCAIWKMLVSSMWCAQQMWSSSANYLKRLQSSSPSWLRCQEESRSSQRVLAFCKALFSILIFLHFA